MQKFDTLKKLFILLFLNVIILFKEIKKQKTSHQALFQTLDVMFLFDYLQCSNHV